MALRNFNTTSVPQTLSVAVGATNAGADQTLTVGATATFPAVPFLIGLDRGTANEEVALCTATTATTFTVSRGYDGSNLHTHAIGGTVEHVTSAIDVREPNSFINTVTAVGDLLIGSGAGTVTNLAAPATGGLLMGQGAGVAPSWFASGASGTLLTGNGAGTAPSWQSAAGTLHVAHVPHTFAVSGLLAVPSGATAYIPGFYVPNSNLGIQMNYVRASIRAGTSATVAVYRNGTAIASLGAISVTTTATTTTSGNNAVSANDYISIAVTAISGSPDGLSFTCYLEYTV